jgi:hypothetical protein
VHLRADVEHELPGHVEGDAELTLQLARLPLLRGVEAVLDVLEVLLEGRVAVEELSVRS